MIEIRVEVRDGGVLSKLQKFSAEVSKIFQDETFRWALRTSNAAKGKAPYITGNLAQSIMSFKSGDGAGVSATVDYAKYVEPPPLGVIMTRNMTRTQFLYNSAMEELENMVGRISEKIDKLLGD